jgi:3-deoxy-D-manno-octulosonic-acid transferase
MIFTCLYNLCLHLYVCISLPSIIRRWGKYKHNLTKRLGKGFPSIAKNGRQLIWIHAVSLGETKAVAPLIKKFKELKNPPLILLSTTTETGHTEGLKSAPSADFHLFLPFDFNYIIGPIIRRTKPDIVILTETDFWYNFQTAARKNGARLIVINGKLSERSTHRLTWMPFLARRLFDPIDHFYLQGELYQKRFAAVGIPLSKLTVIGNIKLDTPLSTCDVPALKTKLGLTPQQQILTLGSTHDPEEKIWIEALKQLWLDFPELKVLLVPRHPERFDTVAGLLEAAHIPYARWREEGTLKNVRVLLIDAMGVLRDCYQISDIAFVGGSLTPKVGGHNILEPSFYGKPVLFGPHMHTQPDLLDLALSYQAGIQVTVEELIPTLKDLLSHSERRHQIGSNGYTLTTQARGALDKTYHALLPLLQKPTPC